VAVVIIAIAAIFSVRRPLYSLDDFTQVFIQNKLRFVLNKPQVWSLCVWYTRIS